MTKITPFPKSDVHKDGMRSGKYVSVLENLFVSLNTNKNKKKKEGFLLHNGGNDVFEIFETLKLSNANYNYHETKTALRDYFKQREI